MNQIEAQKKDDHEKMSEKTNLWEQVIVALTEQYIVVRTVDYSENQVRFTTSRKRRKSVLTFTARGRKPLFYTGLNNVELELL